MTYVYVSLAYMIVNLLLAFIILVKSRRNVLSQFYVFCVSALVCLGITGYMLGHRISGLSPTILEQISAFLYSLFPFFFLHFMLIFVRRYEILKSKSIIVATYFAGIFSYTMVLLKLIPLPFSAAAGITMTGYIYYLTWMSILFSIGVALLYSLIGGFSEKGIQSNLLFVAFAVLMLLLPTPFTLSIFSIVSDNSFELYFISSTGALAVVVYIVFRHRITMNTPYQAMKSALAAMNDILFKTNDNLEIQMVQGAFLPLLGYTESELLGKSLTNLIQQKRLLEDYRTTVLRENKAKEGFFDAEVKCKNGSLISMDFSFTPVFANEEIIGFVGVGRNITERRRAELALQESEARYRTLFESNPSPMWVYDVETLAFLVVNDAAIDHYGYTRNEFLAMTVRDIYPAGDTLAFPDALSKDSARLIRSGSMRHRKKDGSIIEVEISSHELPIGGRPARLALVSDITERKRAERALMESEERYRRFFEEDLTGDSTSTPEGTLLTCNAAFARIFGFASVDDAMRANTAQLFPSPIARETFLRTLREKRKLEYYETELRRIDSVPVYVVENVIGTFDASGELLEIKSYIFDNTERRKLEDQLRQAQKMENLGTLAGGIAHDFNNILSIMSVHASFLRGMNVEEEKFSRSVDAIMKTVQRGAGLVGQLLTFARKTDVLFESVNVNYAVDELTKMLTATFPKTISCVLRLGDNLPTVAADPNQLNQALLNLCVNARDAMPHGGTLTIATTAVEGERLRRSFADARDAQYVCISVADTGTGMDDATRARIFEPFFTTKGVGKGTGLGLAVVYGVIKSHHGFVDVDSAPARGTTFRLYFSAPHNGIESFEIPPMIEDEDVHGTETILLVEDEEILIVAVEGLLKEHGYTVLIARDGAEAIEMFARHAHSIHIVLSDMGLPKQSGWDAFLRMRELNPRAQAIFASGNFDPTRKSEMMKLGARDFIQKPYVPADILKKVRRALNTSAS
ncbi:MAG TPA: PAS domain S-box protein [Bacteroidota bacterium]|nr:PAS domain S-box protein [Bacteroidota bacterium]